MINEETYTATVTSNDDPEKRGRIKVACAGLLGDEDTELPMYVEPCLDWGWFYVPDIGETVDVVVVSSSDSDESRGQMSIDNLDIRWKGQRHYTVDEPENDNTTATQVHPDLKTNYGKRRGFATPHGHTVIFDDTKGSPAIQLTFSKEKLAIGDQVDETNVSRIEIEPDGSFKLNLLGKHTLHLQTEGNKLLLNIDSGSSLEITGKDADTTMKVGDGSVSVAIAEALQNYIDNTVKLWADTHIHNTAMGPSSPATAPLTAYDTAITSTKVTIPDN